ncbi:type II secretion system protein N [Marinomonas algicola]|uniref:type II secretion system protein N n=1 Tax=Marinomonas algicola TaxID=2773454 RepID=UPI00174E6B69|nr:type II secretion system protein N [Marinomonas algicola]
MTFSVYKLESAIRNLLFFILISWVSITMGYFVWTWEDPETKITLPQVTMTSTAHIKSRPTVSENLFGFAAIAEVETDQALTETRLKLLLRGVLPSNQQDQSIAFISSQGQPDKPYRVGDTVSSGVTLHTVFADRVILSRGGIKEVLFFSKNKETLLILQDDRLISSNGVTSLNEGNMMSENADQFSRSGRLVENKSAIRRMASSSAFMQDMISLTPAALLDRYDAAFQNNPESLLVSAGLIATGRSYKVVSGSPLNRVGLRTGDEIVSVNGQAVGNVSNDKGLGGLIRSQAVARIEIRRNEKRFYVNYAVK